MSIWNFIKNLFVIGAEEPVPLQEKKEEPVVPVSNQQIEIEPPKRKPFFKKEENNMSNVVWLVVIDNTDMPEVSALRPAGLQNFYLVNAPDEITAKGFIWRTFGNNQQISDCTHATPISQILAMINSTGKFWSYIPIGGRRSVGQRKVKPKRDSVLANNEYGVPSAVAYQHVPPEVPVLPQQLTAEDIRAANKELGIQPTQSAPQAPVAAAGVPGNMSPEQMMQMFAMFTQMMNGQSPQMPVAPAPAPLSEAQLEKEAENLPGSVSADKLSAQELRRINASKTPSINQDVPLEEDKDLQEAIKRQRKNGKIDKRVNEIKVDINDVPDDIESLAKRITDI
mgnify:CR=1 FL=1